ncbi:HD domain-containing protein [Candidatus Pacearchaeota archaeon]|nr:HD domain-containing protein [Candidatus Pacearchaeota archaeon]
MDNFSIITKEIDNLTKHSKSKIEYSHSHSVLKWVLKLKPDADIALKVAALGHDIDRSYGEPVKKDESESYESFKMRHAARSAMIIDDILKKFDIDDKIRKKVKTLIENHEIGGSGDVEVLKDADSLSFFENNLEHYQRTHLPYLKDKITFMYTRLSAKAKALLTTMSFQNEDLKKIVLDVIRKL